jgi:hypothetical protein
MAFESCVLPGLYVLRWGENPDVPDVTRYLQEVEHAHAVQGELLIGLFIMPDGSAAPDSNFRKAQADHMPRIMSHFHYVVCVFEGEGFMASIRRNALAGILLLSGRRFPVHVRASIQEALVTKPAGQVTFNVPLALAEIRRRNLAR